MCWQRGRSQDLPIRGCVITLVTACGECGGEGVVEWDGKPRPLLHRTFGQEKGHSLPNTAIEGSKE